MAQTLAAEQTDLDLCLVEPASMFGRVMYRKQIPQPPANLLSEPLHQRLAAMRTEIVHDKMDGICLRIAARDIKQEICNLRRTACRSRFGKVTAGLRLHTAENVGRAATLIVRVAPQNSSPAHWQRRTHIGMQQTEFEGGSRRRSGW